MIEDAADVEARAEKERQGLATMAANKAIIYQRLAEIGVTIERGPYKTTPEVWGHKTPEQCAASLSGKDVLDLAVRIQDLRTSLRALLDLVEELLDRDGIVPGNLDAIAPARRLLDGSPAAAPEGGR